VWPRWTKAPPHDGDGEFTSDEPFFDIDEITQTAKFYPPGTPLVDKNLDGNPATRQRVRDIPSGNLWRRRLLVGQFAEDDSASNDSLQPEQVEHFTNALGAADQPIGAPDFESFRAEWPTRSDINRQLMRVAGAAPSPSNQNTQSTATAPSGAGQAIIGSWKGTTAEYWYWDGSKDVRSGGTRTWRNNNPGAMEYGDFAKSHGAIGTDGRFAIFPDEATGTAALDALLRTQRYQRGTIDQAIGAWAPPHENNTAAYQAFVARRLGVPRTTPVSQLTPAQMIILRDAIRTYEGWRPGTSTRSSAVP
jgi:hypothetical protein